MPRNISQEILDEFASPKVRPALFAEFFFDEETVYMWSGYGSFVWNDKEFLGGGNFVGVSPIEETQDLQAKGVVLSLNGVKSENVSFALGEHIRNRKVRLYLGSINTTSRIALEDETGFVLTEDGGKVILENTLIAPPYQIFSGLMDTIEISDDGREAIIRMNVENILIRGQRNKVSRYTAEDQKRRFPNDKGLDFINQLQDKELVW